MIPEDSSLVVEARCLAAGARRDEVEDARIPGVPLAVLGPGDFGRARGAAPLCQRCAVRHLHGQEPPADQGSKCVNAVAVLGASSSAMIGSRTPAGR
jgi:hypothetical protein